MCGMAGEEAEGGTYLAWLEHTDWSELEPGEMVLYLGSIDACHGLTYVVVEQIDVDRYKLKSTQYEWERLNADRMDLTPMDTGE